MRPVALLVAALLAVALAPFPGSPAVASCAGPMLLVPGPQRPLPELAAGREVSVTGEFFLDGCDDTGGQDVIFGCEEEREVETPMAGVELLLRQRGREWSLGTADADARGRIGWDVRVPDGLRPGRARLLTEGSQALVVSVPGR